MREEGRGRKEGEGRRRGIEKWETKRESLSVCMRMYMCKIVCCVGICFQRKISFLY